MTTTDDAVLIIAIVFAVIFVIILLVIGVDWYLRKNRRRVTQPPRIKKSQFPIVSTIYEDSQELRYS
jgi:heme/copper-type cytochrome/quinol oxidase subunit 2